MAVRAVLFDAVGTLIHPWPPVAEAYAAAGLRHGLPLTPNEIAVRFHKALRRHSSRRDSVAARTNEDHERRRWSRIVADVFRELPETDGLFEALWQHFAEAHHWRAYDDVAETLDELQALGLRVAVASNFDERLFGIAAQLSPLDRVPQIYVSSRLGYAKPHPQFFQAIAADLRLPPEQLLLVGDDVESDGEGAQRAGWHSVLLRRGGPREASVIASLRELGEWLATGGVLRRAEDSISDPSCK